MKKPRLEHALSPCGGNWDQPSKPPKSRGTLSSTPVPCPGWDSGLRLLGLRAASGLIPSKLSSGVPLFWREASALGSPELVSLPKLDGVLPECTDKSLSPQHTRQDLTPRSCFTVVAALEFTQCASPKHTPVSSSHKDTEMTKLRK